MKHETETTAELRGIGEVLAKRFDAGYDTVVGHPPMWKI
jgi:hypothetical protein